MPEAAVAAVQSGPERLTLWYTKDCPCGIGHCRPPGALAPGGLFYAQGGGFVPRTVGAFARLPPPWYPRGGQNWCRIAIEDPPRN